MKFDNIYVIGEDFQPFAARAVDVGEVVRGRDIELATGKWKPEKPLLFVQCEGTRWMDFVGTQRPALRLMSARVLDAFSAAKVTGWEAHQIELRTKKGIVVPGYRLLIITGACGPIDNSQSIQIDKIRIVKESERKTKVWKGLYFDEATWDGSDVFCPAHRASIFATQKVKDILEREKATNFDIKSLVDVERVSLI